MSFQLLNWFSVIDIDIGIDIELCIGYDFGSCDVGSCLVVW